MAAYDKADLERRMAGAVEALKHDLVGCAPAAPRSTARSGEVEAYGAQHAAQPGRDRLACPNRA